MENEKPRVFDVHLGGIPPEHSIKLNGHDFRLATRIELDSGKEGEATCAFRVFMPLDEYTKVGGQIYDKDGKLHVVSLEFHSSRTRAFINGERVTYLKRCTAVATATTGTHIWISYRERVYQEDGETWHLVDRILEGNLLPNGDLYL